LIIEIKMPELGENVTEGTIVGWHRKVGETIGKGEILAEVITEKVNREVESPVSGTVVEILYPEESIVKVGETIARIEEKN
jgi:pyruvate/2-oxoglutarate dehydrogenase complex dihydrolipoamide acyltransferase (E2) component